MEKKSLTKPRKPASRARFCSQDAQEVTAKNSTVLGYGADPYWPHLRFKEAQPMTQSSMMLLLVGREKSPVDIHLSVPFAADGDKHMKSEDLGWYRVRPKDESVTGVVRRRGKWYWTYS